MIMLLCVYQPYRGNTQMNNTLDIPMFVLPNDTLIMIAPKGATKLTKAYSGTLETHVVEAYYCPHEAWKIKEQLDNDTQSTWVLWDLSGGLGEIGIIETRAEFEQFYEDWL